MEWKHSVRILITWYEQLTKIMFKYDFVFSICLIWTASTCIFYVHIESVLWIWKEYRNIRKMHHFYLRFPLNISECFKFSSLQLLMTVIDWICSSPEYGIDIRRLESNWKLFTEIFILCTWFVNAYSQMREMFSWRLKSQHLKFVQYFEAWNLIVLFILTT